VSQENVERAHDTAAAYNGGDLEVALQYFSPNVELIMPPEWLEDRVYTGREAPRRVLGSWHEQLDEHHFDVENVIDWGEDRVVSLAYQRGRIKGDDELEFRIAFISDLRDGVAVRVQMYFSWQEALTAVGLPE
jgi:ketosteroid isomerase-like protein